MHTTQSGPKQRRRAFTLVEGLIAGTIVTLCFTIFWASFGRTAQAHTRMSELHKTVDAATLQCRLDEDIRTSIEVIEPARLASGQSLSFYDREYRKVTYELLDDPRSPGLLLRRSVADSPCEATVLAERLQRGSFFRTGPRLVGYFLEFEEMKRPGADDGAHPINLTLRSKVFLNNGLY